MCIVHTATVAQESQEIGQLKSKQKAKGRQPIIPIKVFSATQTVLTKLSVDMFDISISNIECQYIDTFEKYQYRYDNF